MRNPIDASASRLRVILPSRTWLTNSLTMSLPRSWATASLPKRPCATIVSSKDTSVVCASAAFATASFAGLLILVPLTLCAHFGAQFAQFLGLRHCIEERLIELIVALQASLQV